MKVKPLSFKWSFLSPPFFFFLSLILSAILSVSSASWFGAWIGLELNLMSFTPYFSEAALKYFLIQALASTLNVLSSCLIMHASTFTPMIIMMALLLKLGAAPFHFLFPQIMEGLPWLQTIVLMPIQKLAPMFLISYLTLIPLITQIILLSAILSAYVGALGGLNTMK